jgi:vacuolar protein sorting-associated protein 35
MRDSHLFSKARPDLSIQDITALLVSLTNLSLSCYPDRLEYVDQILGFALDKIKEFSERHAIRLDNKLALTKFPPALTFTHRRQLQILLLS